MEKMDSVASLCLGSDFNVEEFFKDDLKDEMEENYKSSPLSDSWHHWCTKKEMNSFHFEN